MEIFLTIILTGSFIWLCWWLQSQVPKGKTGKQLLQEEDRERIFGSKLFDSVRMKEKHPLPKNCPAKEEKKARQFRLWTEEQKNEILEGMLGRNPTLEEWKKLHPLPKSPSPPSKKLTTEIPLIPEKDMPFSLTSEPVMSPAVLAAEIDQYTAGWKNKPKGGIIVVQSEDEADTLNLSDDSMRAIHERRAEGFYHIPSDTVVIIADNLERPIDAVLVTILETTAYSGLRGLFGSQFEAELEKIGQDIPEADLTNIVFDYELDMSKREDRLEAYEEYLGKRADLGKHAKTRNPKLWERFVMAVKTALRALGMDANIIELFDRHGDIDRIIDAGREYVERGNRLEPLAITQRHLDPAVTPPTKAELENWFQQGLKYYSNIEFPHNYTEAVKWFRKAADAGHAKAKARLGDCYKWGHGIAENRIVAVKWYRQAAEQEDADGQLCLGHCYHNGQGVPKDYKEAVKWFRKAAEQGNAEAQLRLYDCYHKGHGVPQDSSEAVKWGLKAVKLYRAAAELGDAKAQNDLAWCYIHGRGVPKDYTEAAKWLRKAAEQGGAYPQQELGIFYLEGRGVQHDRVEAYKWFKLAYEKYSTAPELIWLSSKMTPEQIAEGERRCKEFKVDHKT